MLKHVVLLGVLSSYVSYSWANDYSYEALVSSFYEMHDDDKKLLRTHLYSKEWISIGTTNEYNFDMNYRYLKAKTNDIVESWIKTTVEKDLTKDGLSVGDYTMFLYNFHCSEGSVKLVTYTKYNKAGKNLNSYTSPSYTNFRPVIPETVAEKLIKAACTYNIIKFS